jgi:hypothetical protein
MTDDDARRLAAAWRERARFFRRKNDTLGRSKCHDGERSLHRGLSIMADLCADEIEHEAKRAPTDAKPR